MTSPEVNNDHLHDFVYFHELMDPFHYSFSGSVLMETPQNALSGFVDVRINLVAISTERL